MYMYVHNYTHIDKGAERQLRPLLRGGPPLRRVHPAAAARREDLYTMGIRL